MFSGILGLVNCKMYHLSIYPDSFPNNSHNPSNWNDGFSTSFIYSTSNDNTPPSPKNPTSVNILKDIQSRSVIIDLTAIASAYTCSDVLVEISSQRSIRSDETSDSMIVYNETFSLQQAHDRGVIEELQPCISYRLKISKIVDKDKHIEIYSQNFKTTFDEKNDTLLGLDKNEVILNGGLSPHSGLLNQDAGVTITWADRCVDSYVIKLCRFPIECLHKQYKSISLSDVQEQVTRFELMLNKKDYLET